MSAEILADRAEAEAAHNILARDFTDRYREAAHLSKITYSASYNPNNPLCDYEKTWWSSNPNRTSPAVAKFVLGKMIGISGPQIENKFYSIFENQAEKIHHELESKPIMIVGGHKPDILAALPVVAAARGVALLDERRKKQSFQRGFEDMVNISHVVATRGLTPLVIGKAGLGVPLVRIARLGLNPHFVFPKNHAMEQSGISEEFIKAYNALAKENMSAINRGPSRHPDGLHLLWGMAPAGTRDKEVDLGGGEKAYVIPEVTQGTINLIKSLGCALLPVCTSLANKNSVLARPGNLIYPGRIDQDTLHTVMVKLAKFRRAHGEGEVYYEREPEAGPLLELYEEQHLAKVIAIASRLPFLR